LRVTWPFWTLFVLNPIVGIELPSTHRDEIQLTGWVRWYITYSTVNSPPCTRSATQFGWKIHGILISRMGEEERG
jgi:hypothetical protein